LLEMENAMKRIPDYYEMPFFPNDIWGGQKGEDTVSAHKSKSGALVWVSRDDDGNLILKIIEDTEIIERFKSLLKKIEEREQKVRSLENQLISQPSDFPPGPNQPNIQVCFQMLLT